MDVVLESPGSLLLWIFDLSWYFLFVHLQVFVGLGFPYEGPAPLEAIANGCFFINPKVSKGWGYKSNYSSLSVSMLFVVNFGIFLQLVSPQSFN